MLLSDALFGVGAVSVEGISETAQLELGNPVSIAIVAPRIVPLLP